MSKKGLLWRALVAAGLVMLGACESSPTRIYALDPVVPATRIDQFRAPALHVDNLSVPAGWDRSEILGFTADGGLKIMDFDHWSAPLAQMAKQALSADLEQRLPAGAVIYPHLPKPRGALGVSVDILEFSVSASQASLRASWVITPSGSQDSKRSVALLNGSMTSSEPAGIAHAWSGLIGQLADHIAADAALFNPP